MDTVTHAMMGAIVASPYLESRPIVASAFHPALATVGVLLAVGGYVLGTYAGLACAFLLEIAHGIVMGGAST